MSTFTSATNGNFNEGLTWGKTTANATHSLADNFTSVQQRHQLNLDNCIHSLTDSPVSLIQNQLLVVDNSTHNLTSDAISLVQGHLLSLDNATHLIQQNPHIH